MENCPTANLCTGVVGRKKKKIMYLTTRNAGLVHRNISSHLYVDCVFLNPSDCSFSLLFPYSVILWQSLTGMSYPSMRRWPKSLHFTGRRWFWLGHLEWADEAWRINCSCQILCTTAPPFPVSSVVLQGERIHTNTIHVTLWNFSQIHLGSLNLQKGRIWCMPTHLGIRWKQT